MKNIHLHILITKILRKDIKNIAIKLKISSGEFVRNAILFYMHHIEKIDKNSNKQE